MCIRDRLPPPYKEASSTPPLHCEVALRGPGVLVSGPGVPVSRTSGVPVSRTSGVQAWWCPSVRAGVQAVSNTPIAVSGAAPPGRAVRPAARPSCPNVPVPARGMTRGTRRHTGHLCSYNRPCWNWGGTDDHIFLRNKIFVKNEF